MVHDKPSETGKKGGKSRWRRIATVVHCTQGRTGKQRESGGGPAKTNGGPDPPTYPGEQWFPHNPASESPLGGNRKLIGDGRCGGPRRDRLPMMGSWKTTEKNWSARVSDKTFLSHSGPGVKTMSRLGWRGEMSKKPNSHVRVSIDARCLVHLDVQDRGQN